jgi:MFS family permease
MKLINYDWMIVGIGLLVKMTGLGFGRFAYPMLIPSMRGSLGFNYMEMGLLSGAIMLGYLLFSLAGGLLATRFGPKRIVIASLFCGALSMFFISRLSGFLPLLLHQPFFLGFSALLFGATFLGTVTIIAASIGDQVSERKASVYGLVTLIHGIGQFLGTTFGGYLKDLTGSFQLTLISSLIGFLLCLLLTAFNKKG